MSEENPEVRQAVSVRPRTERRRLEERVAMRFSRVLAFLARAVWRLPPRSRLRQALIRRAVRFALEASNRGDFESTFMLYHPDGGLTTPPQLAGLGFDARYRGREERIGFQRRWVADWGEFRIEPEEIIDLGDCLLTVGRITGSGLSSGAAFDSDWAVLYTVSAGRVIREQVFLDHGEALEAAGLSE